jgi:hypothetical protein
MWCSSLLFEVTDHEFRTFFEQFGAVLDSVVMFDRETRRSRGFGFVSFVDPVSIDIKQEFSCNMNRAHPPKPPSFSGATSFLPQDVSKSLLQMGNHADGIGRVVMRGKTCEVKAAEPKQPEQRQGRRVDPGYGKENVQGPPRPVNPFVDHAATFTGTNPHPVPSHPVHPNYYAAYSPDGYMVAPPMYYPPFPAQPMDMAPAVPSYYGMPPYYTEHLMPAHPMAHPSALVPSQHPHAYAFVPFVNPAPLPPFQVSSFMHPAAPDTYWDAAQANSNPSGTD